MYRPTDRRSARPRPARVLPELLGDSSSQKTLDPGLGASSWSELSWLSGTSSWGEPGIQRKTIHGGFSESQRDLGREAWDTESTPMMMKKKKKKPKQKRYPQPWAGGPYNDDGADKPKGQPFSPDPRKSGILTNQSCVVDMQCGVASRENLEKPSVVDSKTTKLVTVNLAAESVTVPLCPLEALKIAVNSQPKLREDAESKGNIPLLQSQDKKALQQDDCKPQPAPHLRTLDKNQTTGSLNLKGPQTEVFAHKESPLAITSKESCSPVLDKETVSGISKPTTDLLNFTPTLTGSNPLEGRLSERSDETKGQKDKQKGLSEGTEEVRELKKETSLKQNQDVGVLASEQLQDKVLVQVPGPGNETLKRMAGEGKSKKGKGSSCKVRASSGKGKGRSELPLLQDSQKDDKVVLVPNEPTSKSERIATGEKCEELGLDSSKQPGVRADLVEAAVLEELKETSDSTAVGTLQPLVPLGSGSSITEISSARTKDGAVSVDMDVSNQSKEGKGFCLDPEAVPWISERPKKRSSENRNKKFKNNYSTNSARDDKEEITSSPSVGKDGDTGGFRHQNKESGLTFSVTHDPLVAETPTVDITEQKDRNVEVNSLVLGALGRDKKHTVKDSALTKPATTVTDVSCQAQSQEEGYVPSGLSEDSKADVTTGHIALADKPNKRSNNGKSKKVKNSFPEKHILESKAEVTKIHVPVETTGDHRIEGIGYMDENRNITFTCPRTPPGLMNKQTPGEVLESAAREKPPASKPQEGKESDSFSDTLAEIGQGTAPVQISDLPVVDDCSKDGAPDKLKAPVEVMPSINTGEGALTLASAIETVNRGDSCLSNKGKLAEPIKNETEMKGKHVLGEIELVWSGACKQSVEENRESTKGHLVSGLPMEDQSLSGDVRVLKACPDMSNFPAHSAKEKKISEEVSVLGDKAQKPNFYEERSAEDRDSKGLESLNKKVDKTLSQPKNEKVRLEGINTVTELEQSQSTPPGLHSDFLDGETEATSLRGVDILVVTASEDLQHPEPRDEILEVPEKITGKSEPKILGEGKKGDKSRMTEPMKGYMRPTKARGLTPILPKTTVQERERSKQLKSSGMNLPWGDVCAYSFWRHHPKRQKACAWILPRL